MFASSIGVSSVDDFGMGFEMDKERWQYDGITILFDLTRQYGFPWCNMANQLLAATVLESCKNSFFQTNTEGDVGKMMLVLRGVVSKTVSHLLGIGGLGLYTINFVDLVGHDPATKAQWKEHQLAVAMGSHSRLGQRSSLACLDAELLRMICE